MTKYCAIIGDINRSRSLPRRGSVQVRFATAVDTINREFKREIASRFLLTLGDEFQGLLHSPGASYQLARRFQEIMKSVPFSFGIGIGSLSSALRKEALGMDGEVFHRARAALGKAKKAKREIVFDFDSPAAGLTNALVGLLERERHRLTPRQREIVQLVKDARNQQAVARRLRISQPAVSKVISSARRMTEAELALHEFLRFLQT